MSDPITLCLTAHQRNCIKAAIVVALEHLENPEVHQETGRSVIDAVNEAKRVMGVEYGYRCNDARTERIDELWQLFWDQTCVDFGAWFRGDAEACEGEDLSPKGWPDFRDRGLKKAGL